MKLQGSVAFVTGANRGLGEQFTRALLESGAAAVYAGARDPSKVTVPGADPVAVDITDHDSVLAAADRAQDVTLLVNNAGSTTRADILTADLDAFRTEFETHVLGTLAMSRAFAPSSDATVAARSSTCSPCCPGCRSRRVPDTPPPRPPNGP